MSMRRRTAGSRSPRSSRISRAPWAKRWRSCRSTRRGSQRASPPRARSTGKRGRALATSRSWPCESPPLPKNEPMKIENHAFLVAGGGSGLGAATARMLVDAGAKVVVADLNDAAEWSNAPASTVRYLRTDVTDEAEVQAAVELCASAFGAIHGAVNCAGIAPGARVVGKAGPHPLATFERAVRINLTGTFNVIRLAATEMSAQAPEASGERGVIVNTSSVASMDGQIGQAAYAASKAGVNGMTLPIARELARFGIRVMTIDRKSTRLNSSHLVSSYAVFCLKNKRIYS